MRNVGIKELKDQASAIVNAGEAVIVEKHGRPVGMYVPLGQTDRQNKAQAYQYAERLQQILGEIAAKNGLSPEEWDAEMDRLFPEDNQVAPRR